MAGNDIDTGLGLKLEESIQLEEQKESIQFRLTTVVFREGGHTDGHYFLAVQERPGSWLVYNSSTMRGPYDFKALQAEYAAKVQGVVYVRKQWLDNEQFQQLDRWLNAFDRYSSSPLYHMCVTATTAC